MRGVYRFASWLAAVLLASGVAAAPPRSDDFRGGLAPYWRVRQTLRFQRYPTPSCVASNGRLFLRSANRDIYGDRWEPYYIYQEATGDFSVRLEVLEMPGQDPYGGVGLMLAQSAPATYRSTREIPPWAMVLVTRQHGVEVKGGAGRTSFSDQGPFPTRLPCWLRLDRRGGRLSFFWSADRGRTWQPTATSLNLRAWGLPGFHDPVLVGIAAQTHSGPVLGTAVVGPFQAIDLSTAPTAARDGSAPRAGPARGRASSLAFSPRGDLLAEASVEDAVVRLWDLRRRRVRWTAPYAALPDDQLGFSPEGRTLYAVGEGGTSEWDTAAGRPVGLVLEMRWVEEASGARTSLDLDRPRHRHAPTPTDRSPDDRLLAVMERGQARLLESESGRPVRSLPLPQQGGQDLLFSPNGRSLATAAGGDTVQVWDPRTGVPTVELRHRPPSSPVESLLLLMVVVSGLVVLLFLVPALDPVRSALRLRTQEERWRCQDCRFTGPAGDFASPEGSTEGRRTRCPKCGGRYVEIRGSAAGLGRLPRWLLLALAVEAGLAVYALRVVDPRPAKAAQVRQVAFSPDCRYLATGAEARPVLEAGGLSESQVRVWEVRSGRLVGLVPRTRYIAFCPDGETALLGGEERRRPRGDLSYGPLRLFSLRTRRVRAKLREEAAWPYVLAFSRDGRTLAAAGGKGILLWNTRTGRLEGRL